jgi:hypothetical protein
MKKKTAFSILIGLIAAGGIGYLIYRYFISAKTKISPDVAEKLPMAKDLQTVADGVGNYDLDGVSFDTEGVIVSGDAHKTVVAPI